MLHGEVSGNTGSGKSSDFRLVLSALASVSVLWLIDGKRGTSLPEMRRAFDWYSTDPDEWRSVIQAAYDVMDARRSRRGRAGLSYWSRTEADPEFTLVVEESSAVTRMVGKSEGRYSLMVLEMIQHGRALGVRVVQGTQDSVAMNWLGGRQTRTLLNQGWVLSHAAGGNEAARLARDGANEKIDLLALPAQPGWAAVRVGGEVIAHAARLRYASEDATEAWAGGFEARTLTGDDLRAAGTAYARRGLSVVGTPAAALAIVAEDETEDELTETETSQVQQWVLKVLAMNRGGLTLAELTVKGQGTRGRKRRNLSKHLAQLKDAGQVEQVEGARWALTEEAA